MRGSLQRVLFVGEASPQLQAALREAGVNVETAQGDSFPALLGAVRRFRPAVIHARKAHLGAALAGKIFGVPVALEAPPGAVFGSFARASSLATRTLCGGGGQRDAAIAAGAPAARVTVVRSLLRSSLHRVAPLAPIGNRRVVCAAPLDDDRGVSDVFLAFLTIARSRPSARLVLCGRGDGAWAMAQAEAAGLRGRVELLPARPDQLANLFTDASVAVAPARDASAIDAVPEALAAGAPVVATAVGQHPTWIREGRTGFLVPPRAPAALAARLAQVLDDHALATRVGDLGRAAAEELCLPHNQAAELKRVYAALARPLPLADAGLGMLHALRG